MQTVSKGKADTLITMFSVEKMEQVRQALPFALGFGD
jgi:hypothetical protein